MSTKSNMNVFLIVWTPRYLSPTQIQTRFTIKTAISLVKARKSSQYTAIVFYSTAVYLWGYLSLTCIVIQLRTHRHQMMQFNWMHTHTDEFSQDVRMYSNYLSLTDSSTALMPSSDWVWRSVFTWGVYRTICLLLMVTSDGDKVMCVSRKENAKPALLSLCPSVCLSIFIADPGKSCRDRQSKWLCVNGEFKALVSTSGMGTVSSRGQLEE